MPAPSSQKKIRDLERLKKKLGDSADAEKLEQINAKIEEIKAQKDENIQNEDKVKARNMAKRVQSNPKSEKNKNKENKTKTPVNKVKGAFGNSMQKAADGSALFTGPEGKPNPVKLTKKRTVVEAESTDAAAATAADTFSKHTAADHKANMKKIIGGGKEKPAATDFDPFFIDPKASNLVNNEGGEFHHKKLKKGEELHLSMENLKRYAENGKYFHNHSMSSHNQFMNHKVDTSKMNKQELRLYNWQMKEREKRMNRTAGLFGGMSAAQVAEASGGKGSAGAMPKSADNRSARREAGANNRSQSAGAARGSIPYNNKSSTGGGVANRGGAGNVRTKPGVGANARTGPTPAPAAAGGEKTSATWMQGAGVSAAAMTEEVKNKAKGVIVAAQGKKITFD